MRYVASRCATTGPPYDSNCNCPSPSRVSSLRDGMWSAGIRRFGERNGCRIDWLGGGAAELQNALVADLREQLFPGTLRSTPVNACNRQRRLGRARPPSFSARKMNAWKRDSDAART